MRVMLNAAALTAIREKDGQSQAELARNAGVDPTNLNKYESGKKNAGAVVRKRLAVALNVRLSAIEAQLIEAPEPPAEDIAA
jgi:transcriptional regulator with XRE-family HTH domain